MAGVRDARAKIKAISDALRAKLPEIAETLALSAKAISERRIKAQGIGEKYSTNPVPAWFFSGKELNSGGQAWLKQHGVNTEGKAGAATHRAGKKLKKGQTEEKTDRTGTWGEFRAAQGLQNDHVDYSYSNKMWAAMAPQRAVETNGMIVSVLGATNKEAQNKMNWNRDRDGDFVGKAITEQDRTTLNEVVIDEVRQVINTIDLKP